MHCPNCHTNITDLDVLSNNKMTKLGDKNWHKLQTEEQLTCPNCSTNLKLNASIEFKVKTILVLILFLIILLSSFVYSTALFVLMALLVAISATPLFNYLLNKYGELVEINT